jgi:hypothetical protein
VPWYYEQQKSLLSWHRDSKSSAILVIGISKMQMICRRGGRRFLGTNSDVIIVIRRKGVVIVQFVGWTTTTALEEADVELIF